MTVWIYVDSSKQVGDVGHLKVFANEDAAEHGCRKMTPKGWCSSMRCWSKFRPDAPPAPRGTLGTGVPFENRACESRNKRGPLF